MANNIKLTLPASPFSGQIVTFTAPCDCSAVKDGLVINGEIYTVCDTMGECVTGKGGAWVAGAQLSVLLDCENKKAYIQGGGTGGAGTGENLLHNWYFGDPVNSRGDTLYTYGRYSIDRWRNNYFNNLVLIEDGYVQWAWNRDEGAGLTRFHQRLEHTLLPGEYTLSALIVGINGAVKMYVGNSEGEPIGDRYATLDLGLNTITYTVTEEMDANRVQFFLPENGLVELVAVKLERGTRQTLATKNKDGEWELLDRPNKALETLKCVSSEADPDDSYANHTNLHTGNIGEYFPEKPIVQTGSYTGTGTGGEDNPNSLTFDRVPMMVIISGEAASVSAVNSRDRYTAIWHYGMDKFIVDHLHVDLYGGEVQATLSGTTLSWYYDSTADRDFYQLNADGENYTYIAVFADGGIGPKGDKGARGEQGPRGVGIASVSNPPTSYFEVDPITGKHIHISDTYTITLTDNRTYNFEVKHGKDGVGVASVSWSGQYSEYDATTGVITTLYDTYTITLTNGETFEFKVYRGEQGPRGEKGARGDKGAKGDPGEPFSVAKTYASVDEMNADFDNADIKEGSFVVISSDTEDEDNAKMYVKGATEYSFVTDLSGVKGIKGDAGVGIKNIEKTAGDGSPGATDTYRFTMTDGGTFSFDVYNGKDGKNGVDGITPHIGDNGNWWIGDIDTGVCASGGTFAGGGGVAVASAFTVTLPASSWTDNTQTISDDRFVVDGFSYLVTPVSDTLIDYATAFVYASDVVTEGEMTFNCQTVPSVDLAVNIVRMEVEEA